MGGPGGGGGGYATTGSIGATEGSGGDAVDECGLRFLLAMRHHTCLLRSLPLVPRAKLEQKVGMFWRLYLIFFCSLWSTTRVFFKQTLLLRQ